MATIEVKSLLDRTGVEQAVKAAAAAKRLERHMVSCFSAGYEPPSVLNYVVAYDGPPHMGKVHEWVRQAEATQGLASPVLPIAEGERLRVAAPSLDGVFVLGKGFWYFDNVRVRLMIDRATDANAVYCDGDENNLLRFFLFLTQAVSGLSGSWLDPVPYLKPVQFRGVWTSR